MYVKERRRFSPMNLRCSTVNSVHFFGLIYAKDLEAEFSVCKTLDFGGGEAYFGWATWQYKVVP